MAKYSSIYQQFWTTTAPAGLAAAWPCFGVDGDCRSCPEFGTATLARLAEDHLEQDLISSGLAKALPDGLVLNPVLAGPDNYIIALRHIAEGPPDALLTAAGSIPHGPMAIVASLGDPRTHDCAIQHTGTLFVAFTIDDLVYMRGCGFPATLASGLENVTMAAFVKLYEACHWANELSKTQNEFDGTDDKQDDIGSAEKETNGTENTDSETAHFANELRHIASLFGTIENETDVVEPIDLILVGWSPPRMLAEEPAALRLVTARLLGLEKFFNADVSRIAIWRPTRYDLEKFEFCRAAGSSADLISELRNSAATSLFSLPHTLEPADQTPAPASYQETLRILRKLRDEPAGLQSTSQIAIAHTDFERAVEVELIQPLLDEGAASGDPIQHNLAVIAASFARDLHLKLPFVSCAEQGSSLGLWGPTAGSAMRDHEALGKLADRVLKFMRELRQ